MCQWQQRTAVPIDYSAPLQMQLRSVGLWWRYGQQNCKDNGDCSATFNDGFVDVSSLLKSALLMT